MKKIILLLSLLVFITNINYSQTTSERDFSPVKSSVSIPSLELKNKVMNDDGFVDLNKKVFEDRNSSSDSTKEKNPLLSGAMSAVIPGLGQLYTKNYIKSAIFLAVEAGLWFTYAHFEKKGDDQTDYYQNYANANWSIKRYAYWLQKYGFPGSGGINLNAPNEVLRSQVNVCEDSSGFSHRLPEFGDQQYYEVIGKYQTYISGWSTADPNIITRDNFETYHLAQVTQYMADREQANTYYDHGTTAITIVILNHLLSAADAIWDVSVFNKRLEMKTSMKVSYTYNYFESKYRIAPFANLKVSF